MTGYVDENKEEAYFLTDFQLFYEKAEAVYKKYQEQNSRSLRWISSSYFTDQLKEDLKEDTKQFIELLKISKDWNPQKDLKVETLEGLLKSELKEKKTLVFTQFRETAEYLQNQLQTRSLKNIALITGKTDNIQNTINKFSPRSNNFDGKQSHDLEIDILVATDVLSEGQNLQDCNIVVNYDLPWAIIKLIQRVGRIDRIGQQSDKILCYSFMPDDGLEEQIRLRGRIQNRLKENAEVIGTDEHFFEAEEQILIDLYNEKSKTLEKEISEDIDLASYALEIWNKGIEKDPSLEGKIKNMPDVVHASKEVKYGQSSEEVLLFAKSHINNYLLCLDKEGRSVTEDQMAILKKAECQSSTKPLQRTEKHYEIVQSGLNTIEENLKQLSSQSGSLGTSRNPRRKLFEKLESINEKSEEIIQIIDDIYHYPFSNEAEQTLKRMFRRKISDKEILKLVYEKHRNETLVNKKESKKMDEKPKIVCSMGLLK